MRRRQGSPQESVRGKQQRLHHAGLCRARQGSDSHLVCSAGLTHRGTGTVFRDTGNRTVGGTKSLCRVTGRTGCGCLGRGDRSSWRETFRRGGAWRAGVWEERGSPEEQDTGDLEAPLHAAA